eukprot:7152810-Pyramimonas_sp.AAC.1
MAWTRSRPQWAPTETCASNVLPVRRVGRRPPDGEAMRSAATEARALRAAELMGDMRLWRKTELTCDRLSRRAAERTGDRPSSERPS